MLVLGAVFLFFAMCGLVPCNPRWDPVDTSFDPGQNLDFSDRRDYLIHQQTTAKFPPPVVYSPNGPVQGFFMTVVTGRRILAFEAIPYAEPPVGYRRFRPSVLKRPWTKILTATKPPPNCLQAGFGLLRITGSEDCLYLNVYTPKLRLEDGNHPNFPVIVFSHGGINIFGAGSLYGPAYLLARNVIFITINYRLGIFGFATSGDAGGPGNLGIKDHITALEWVQKNIYSFGGDPSRVTLMGQSFGGSNVHLLFFAPKARPLFHAGISIGGTAFTPYLVRPVREIKNLTQMVAQSFFCPTDNSWRMMECMREQSGYKMLEKSTHFGIEEVAIFTAVVEPANETSPILTASPEEEYYKGNVQRKPFISGITTHEGLLSLGLVSPGLVDAIKNRIYSYAPRLLNYAGRVVNEDVVTDKVLEYYFEHPMQDYHKGQLRMVEKVTTDRFYMLPLYKAVEFHSQVAPTFPYLFDFRGKVNIESFVFGFQPNETGPVHADDLIHLVNSTQYPGIGRDLPQEMVVSRTFCNLIVNFATTLRPTYTVGKNESNKLNLWPDVKNPRNISFLHFGPDKLEVVKDPYEERIKFWESLNIVGLDSVKSFNKRYS